LSLTIFASFSGPLGPPFDKRGLIPMIGDVNKKR
jgi:hypothetical protein